MSCRALSRIGLLICLVALPIIVVSPALAIRIDGNVQKFGEGYTSQFDVSFDIENGPTNVGGGSLFTHETTDLMFFGLILPQTIVDNTYGDTRALDWGSKEHFLIGGGGGKSLEGSDKLELKYKKREGDPLDFELKLDYIEEKDGIYNARIEKLKKDGNDINKSQIAFKSSLDYNYNELALTDFFGSEADDEDGDPIDSPEDFSNGWLAAVMYEFSIEKDVISGDWFNFDDVVIHASPNKLSDKHKIFINTIDPANPVPEPATMLLLGCGLIGLAGFGRKRLIRK